MIDFKIDKSGKVGMVLIEGKLTTECADELKRAIVKAFDSTEHIIFNLEGVAEIDLCCFHILCTAHKTLMRLNKCTTLYYGNHPEVFRELPAGARYLCHSECGENGVRTCLWEKKG